MNTLLRGIKRVHSRSGKPARVRLLITASLMHSIKGPLVLQPQNYNSVMVWAVCCTGFFGFLRRGEFLIPDDAHFNPDIHLALDDITLADHQGRQAFHLKIKVSKMDQLCRGDAVVLSATGADIYPVHALLDYLGHQGSGPGPLFVTHSNQLLWQSNFVTQVLWSLHTAGSDGSLFISHSFRIGAAITASAAGISETIIQHLRRWQRSAYQLCIHPSVDDLASVSRQLAQPCH